MQKPHSIIASILTVIFLLVLGLVLLFGQVIAMNGFSESAGMISLVTSLVCQGVTVILAAILTGRLSKLFVEKFNWNNIVAVIISVLAGTMLGGMLAFAAVLLSILLTEGMR